MRSFSAYTRRGVCAAVTATTLLCGGCVERTLFIRSEPAGAAVALNGNAVGTTPIEVPFMTYGTYEVTASAPGHQRLRTQVPVDAPWYQQIPIDFFAEMLWPFTVRDQHEIALQLEPLDREDEAGVEMREGALRERVESTAPAPAPSEGH